MTSNISDDWMDVLRDEFEKGYFSRLVEFVNEEYSHEVVYPFVGDIFRSFDKCRFADLKVVIIGQDPYHGDGQANGLCFSVNDGVLFPASLKNIFKEIYDDLGKDIPASGNLDRWSEQGVLLLNSTLTVRAHTPTSHSNKGWEEFTDSVVRNISQRKSGIVYILWGSYARRKCSSVDPTRNCILTSVHPSPLSSYRGFFGCGHFSKANAYLEDIGKTPIDW